MAKSFEEWWNDMAGTIDDGSEIKQKDTEPSINSYVDIETAYDGFVAVECDDDWVPIGDARSLGGRSLGEFLQDYDMTSFLKGVVYEKTPIKTIKDIFNDVLDQFGEPPDIVSCVRFFEKLQGRFLDLINQEDYLRAESAEEHLAWFESLKEKFK